MMLKREKVVRLKPLNVCSGTLHSISSGRKPTLPKALVAPGNRFFFFKILKLLSRVIQSMEFSMPEYWSG